MSTFDIKIRQSGRVMRFSALAADFSGAFRLACEAVAEGVAFGIVVRRTA
ncbi:MAG: hypothetical protein WC208_09550 [Gallionella sp.]|jgi:hypothetical protein